VEQLDSTLLKALHRSHTLVVIANRGTLEEPRWVRTEVEEFRRRHADRPITPISIAGAVQDATLAEQTRPWLTFDDKIWLDESEEAVANGIASDGLVERLALAPSGRSSNVKWRWVVCAVVAVLAVLTVAAIGVRNSRTETKQGGQAPARRRGCKSKGGAGQRDGGNSTEGRRHREREGGEAPTGHRQR
jgi:hypothetical protein